MIDFHSHILPGIDDGSKDIEQSIELLKRENSQQVTDVVFTPHFYADKISFQKFQEQRERSFQKLSEAVSEQRILFPRFYLGAEVRYFDGMGKADILPKLCIRGTNTLLIEMPFRQWDEAMLQDLQTIMDKQKLQIMLAHVERYPSFQKKKKVMHEIFSMPLILQMNAGSFLKWQKRRHNMKLLKQGAEVLLGTDCHNTVSRVPNLAEGRAVIAKKLGEEYLERIDVLGERILQR